MAKKVKFQPYATGFREIMKSRPVKSLMLKSARQMKNAADSMGSGKYEADVIIGKVSAHGMVKTTDYRSMRSNAKHNTLVKSIDAGRV